MYWWTKTKEINVQKYIKYILYVFLSWRDALPWNCQSRIIAIGNSFSNVNGSPLIVTGSTKSWYFQWQSAFIGYPWECAFSRNPPTKQIQLFSLTKSKNISTMHNVNAKYTNVICIYKYILGTMDIIFSGLFGSYFKPVLYSKHKLRR